MKKYGFFTSHEYHNLLSFLSSCFFVSHEYTKKIFKKTLSSIIYFYFSSSIYGKVRRTVVLNNMSS